MGEVYRADDLKLGQPVALKFLPAELERDEARLARFMNEVRTARQVAHPNVCRVYDVGEIDGHHYISMEYVDGEDLGSLLRRIGRLPADKGVEVARQISAGLAAAHDAGVLHRDLKPANVMIDGRGRARITDFGLAALGGVEAGDEARFGTPAYMSPEQLAGEEVTLRSDVYALGLVLYELLTGKPPFKASSAAELRELQTGTEPTSPSSMAGGLDPAVERVILRCLDPVPSRRPASALAVVAALPGGDPLAAALAAGETPSPELVAAAGDAGGLTPRAGVAVASATLAGALVVALLSAETQLVRLAPLEKPPEVLKEKALDILRDLGYDEAPADSLAAFEVDTKYLDRLEDESTAPELTSALRRARPAAILFRYRQSPRYLVRVHHASIGDWFRDPPPDLPGMIEISLDTQGRLTRLRVTPGERAGSDTSAAEPDWGVALAAAGFDAEALTLVEPSEIPPIFADRRTAWRGREPEAPDMTLQIEAASLSGRVVAFEVSEQASTEDEPADNPAHLGNELADSVGGVVFISVLAGAIFLARRNVRHGRGDARGALRFAIYLGVVRLLWVLGSHHVPVREELTTFVSHLAWSMYRVGLVALMYLALEPYARRLWPRMLVSWTRLWHGRPGDPLVGRDALAGCALGVLGALMTHLQLWLPSRWGLEPALPIYSLWSMESMRGLRHAVTAVLAIHTSSTVDIFFPLTLFLFLTLVTRRAWIGIGITSALGMLIYYPGAGNIPLYVTTMAAFMVVFWLALFRFGFLCVILAATVGDLLRLMPLTFDLSAPYAAPSILTMLVVAGLTLFALRTSLAGRPLFRDALLDPQPAR